MSIKIKERRQREREKRKREILDAAYREFSQKGFKKSIMAEIAARAELSPGAIYLYFKNKEDIYINLSILILEKLSMKIETLLKYDVTPRKKFEKLCSVLIEEYHENPTMLFTLFRFQAQDAIENISDTTLREFQNGIAIAHEGVARIIKEGIEKKFLKKVNPAHLADVIWGFYTGMVLWSSSEFFLEMQGETLSSSYLKTAFNTIIEKYLVKEKDEPIPNLELV